MQHLHKIYKRCVHYITKTLPGMVSPLENVREENNNLPVYVTLDKSKQILRDFCWLTCESQKTCPAEQDTFLSLPHWWWPQVFLKGWCFGPIWAIFSVVKIFQNYITYIKVKLTHLPVTLVCYCTIHIQIARLGLDTCFNVKFRNANDVGCTIPLSKTCHRSFQVKAK